MKLDCWQNRRITVGLVTDILQAGDSGSIGHQDVTQAQYREQIDAINDAIRQLAGKPTVEAGQTVENDPLSPGYVLYVNQDIGSDAITFGDYSTFEDDQRESESIMRRITQQQLLCGYTDARPFKTINRAVLEAGILTSRDYHNDCSYFRTRVTIVVSGMQIVYNGYGISESEDFFTERYTDGQEITPEDLQNFNAIDGGVLLPRGCSVVSLDLRKSIITPNFVPAPVDRNETWSNQAQMLLTTGQAYLYGFTFMDKPGFQESHHLLTTFGPASEAELDSFYNKIALKFGDDIDFGAYLETDVTEHEIVGPQPATPSIAVDTTDSASPYLYNCSIRSKFGLCGVNYDGSRISGFKSMVMAQYTGVSLQTDYRAFEKYITANCRWEPVDNYAETYELDPNHVRMKPEWSSFHIRASNKAVIQEVSVFAIGQNVHHWVDSAGEITITNSNSNFGGVAALAEGFNDKAQPQDTPWQVEGVRRALDPFAKDSSVKKIYIGRLDDTDGVNNVDTKVLTLVDALNESSTVAGQPDILARNDFSLKEGDYLWVRNPAGPDYRAKLAANPWEANPGNIITLAEPMLTEDSKPPTVDEEEDEPDDFAELKGLDIYIRRVIDSRNQEERTVYLLLNGNNPGKRTPQHDYVLRDINNAWDTDHLAAVHKVTNDMGGCTTRRIELRNAAENCIEGTFSSNKYYRKGDTVRRWGLHFNCIVEGMYEWDPCNWIESYKHMPSKYMPGGAVINSHPKLKFDGDTDPAELTETCGWALTDPLIEAQIESATDYKGLAYYLLSADTVGIDLMPQEQLDRDLTIEADDIEFRRPSQIRLFGHAYEWAGVGNYSTGLPKYQQDLTPANKWTFYKTEVDAGKCYISGFNEEGYLVTNNGLQDLESGESLSFADFGAPDQDFRQGGASGEEPVEIFEAKTDVIGIASLADATLATTSSKPQDLLDEWNTKINAENRIVTPPFLDLWKTEAGLLTAPEQGMAAIVIHVIPEGAPEWVDDELGVPWGVRAGATAKTRYMPGRYGAEPARTVTEALRRAAVVFAPGGTRIIISLHGDTTTAAAPESGPMQILNSWAPVMVAAARGLGLTKPKVYLDENGTRSSFNSRPEYEDLYAFSAGVIWSDIHLICNCRNTKYTVVAFNGGFGIGYLGTKVEIDNMGAGCSLISAGFGEQAEMTIYAPVNRADVNNIQPNNTYTFEVQLNSYSTSDTKPTLDIFGTKGGAFGDSGSGLFGHGVDVKIDFLEANYGNSATRTDVKFKFTNNSGKTPYLSFLKLGGRGGCRAGGRIGPEVIHDFSNTNWNLTGWVSDLWYERANSWGAHYQMKQPINMNAATQATIPSSVQLINGSNLDMFKETIQCGGPFSLYQYYEGGGQILTADNSKNGWIYTSGNDQWSDRNK